MVINFWISNRFTIYTKNVIIAGPIYFFLTYLYITLSVGSLPLEWLFTTAKWIKKHGMTLSSQLRRGCKTKSKPPEAHVRPLSQGSRHFTGTLFLQAITMWLTTPQLTKTSTPPLKPANPRSNKRKALG